MGTRTSRPAQEATHRLPPGAVEGMLARQDGRCLICRRDLDRYVVDHDHTLARLHGHDEAHGCPRCVRALLCPRCNGLLGAAGDDPETLERAAAYVRTARRAHG